MLVTRRLSLVQSWTDQTAVVWAAINTASTPVREYLML